MQIENCTNQNPVVSILCITYNHEAYIRQCLDGFVMQKTNFSFEVLVHDDASPDYTAEIIREYEKKFPDIIKPVYQKENQYSKGVHILTQILMPKAKGKYIAICEGDDYWTDPLKLQKQFDVMEQNPDCRLCLHAVRWVSKEGEDLGKTLPTIVRESGKYDSFDFTNYILSEYALRYFPHINSCFFRSEDMQTYIKTAPAFYTYYKETGVADAPLILYLVQLGATYFFSDIMSVYRPWSVVTSASLRKFTYEEKLKNNTALHNAVKSYDAFTYGRFHESCMLYCHALDIWRAIEMNEYRYCVRPENRKLLREIVPNRRLRLKIYIGAYFPKVIEKYDAWKKAKQSANG